MARAMQYSKAFPPRKHPDGTHLCRQHDCNNVLKSGIRSFCSEACKEKALIHCWPAEQRRQTLKRDNGICAKCGLDCIAAWKIINHAPATPLAWRQGNKGLTWVEVFLGIRISPNRRSFWDANHIVAVQDGGTSDLDNLETLCLLCHKAHTAALKRKRKPR